MDRTRYDAFVSTFFDCDPKAVTGIFQEFLDALKAEASLPPGHYLSQNYETAQANPEIHLLPGNLKDARDAVFPYFWGTDGWRSPLHLENVRGPANTASLIGAIACLLKNPNLCTDSYSQRSNELEVKAITALANLVFYHTIDPWGVFTMGGSVSNMYGAKIGVEKVVPGAMQHGLGATRVAGICSEAAHYCAATVAGWLGIGTDNLHAIPTDRTMAMRLDLLADKLDELYRRGDAVAFVIGTFGSTDASGVDDIAGIRRVIDTKAQEHGRPAPQLHADAAVGWGLCFLNEYDTSANPFQVNADTLPVIEKAKEFCRGLRVADSVTIDFHKTGRGHYPSSAFLVNRQRDLACLARTTASMPYFSDAIDRRDPAMFTLETSRPALGPYTVMASLDGIGLHGWQMLIARSLELAEYLKAKLARLDYCMVLNAETAGPTVVWWVLPKGRNAKQIYADLEAGHVTADDVDRYTAEVRRLFNKRVYAMDPAIDARLSLTTDIGYRPHGHKIPGWKCALFNPKTDEAILDRLITSIEDL
jgi:glutamate/tyrosine decarboxylase-like PLP-dependent enzyme